MLVVSSELSVIVVVVGGIVFSLCELLVATIPARCSPAGNKAMAGIAAWVSIQHKRAIESQPSSV